MSGLQNKMYNYEQTPPEKVWDKIAAALDESHISDEFPSKLYNAEVAPPAAAWEKIADTLNAEDPKVIAIQRRSFPLFRYAAAVIVIGIISFTVIKLTGKNNKNSERENGIVSKNTDTTDKKETSPIENNPSTNIVAEKPSDKKDENLIVATEPAKPGSKKSKVRYAVSDNIDITEPIYAYEHTPNLADRYIMLMTPNGIIRMSKKWGNLVCCVSGQEQDEDCKDQIKKWQEKLACSPTTSTGNFIDILSLVSSLDSEL